MVAMQDSSISPATSDLCSRLDLLTMCLETVPENDIADYMNELLDLHYTRFVGFCESMRGQIPTRIEMELHTEVASFLTTFSDGRELVYYRREPLDTDIYGEG